MLSECVRREKNILIRFSLEKNNSTKGNKSQEKFANQRLNTNIFSNRNLIFNMRETDLHLLLLDYSEICDLYANLSC